MTVSFSGNTAPTYGGGAAAATVTADLEVARALLAKGDISADTYVEIVGGIDPVSLLTDGSISEASFRAIYKTEPPVVAAERIIWGQFRVLTAQTLATAAAPAGSVNTSAVSLGGDSVTVPKGYKYMVPLAELAIYTPTDTDTFDVATPNIKKIEALIDIDNTTVSAVASDNTRKVTINVGVATSNFGTISEQIAASKLAVRVGVKLGR